MSRRRTGGIWASVSQTAVAKIVVMGLSGILGIFTSRMIIEHFGAPAYAQYGLLTSIPALLPFADLGIAAVVINAIAGSDDPKRDLQVRRSIVTAFRILTVSGAIIMLVAVLITVLGLWPAILGNGLMPDGGSIAAFLCLATFGFVLPLTVGQRILIGVGKTSTQVATQAIAAPVIFLGVWLFVVADVDAGPYVSVLSYVASGIVAAVCLWLSARSIRPQVWLAMKEVPRLRSAPGVPAFALAWPMVVQMIALPIAMQTDRLLLSHLTDGPELAQYNLATQLFGLVIQTIGAAGLALWPIYAKARSAKRVESPLVPTLWFLGGGLALALILALISPWIAGFVSGGKITLGFPILIPYIVFVALQAAKYPVGMYMTDQRGLQFQVLPILCMVPLNLGLSWLLIPVFGAAGPIIGSAVSVAICQVVPNLWYVQRDLAKRRALAREEADVDATS
ncbi:lipopolysaccharide biosynthesis protein [Plantibacter sp. Mn2098]|uniref:lipopolysaccharide biosynthesis protein n=1 Tax=Plantibacter sp. Mn2098 TaxID=3395266 RepID=UPI003BDD8C90